MEDEKLLVDHDSDFRGENEEGHGVARPSAGDDDPRLEVESPYRYGWSANAVQIKRQARKRTAITHVEVVLIAISAVHRQRCLVGYE